MSGKPTPTELRARVLELRETAPELTQVEIGQRVGLDPSTVRRLLSEAPPMRKADITVGDRVRITKRGRFHRRTGVVVEVPGFPFRDHRRVALDPTETERGVTLLLPLEQFSFVERTGQLGLFGGAA
jgi:hypothetical protein